MDFTLYRFLTAARAPYSALAHCGATTSTANQKEIDFYNKHAQNWWDPKGPFKALLPYNDVRIPFIERQLQRTRTAESVAKTSPILKGVRILDVGWVVNRQEIVSQVVSAYILVPMIPGLVFSFSEVAAVFSRRRWQKKALMLWASISQKKALR